MRSKESFWRGDGRPEGNAFLEIKRSARCCRGRFAPGGRFLGESEGGEKISVDTGDGKKRS